MEGKLLNCSELYTPINEGNAEKMVKYKKATRTPPMYQIPFAFSNMKVLLTALLAVAVTANVPAYKPLYPATGYPEPAYSKPSYPATYAKSYDYAPMPYNFAWAVKDEYTYNDYAHQESSDDKGYVTGSYRVLLPDGRTQIVNYKADDYTGYVADVRYEGEAKYDYKPAYKPEYKPAYQPEYKPAYKPEYKPEYKQPAYKSEYKQDYKPEYKPAYPALQYPTYPASKYPSKY